MEEESVKELNVAESTEVEEETTETEEVEFTDTVSEDNNEDTINDEQSTEETETEEQEETSQLTGKSAKYADIRRKAEDNARVKYEKTIQSKVDEAYQKGMLAAYKGKINPYTNTEIKDITDIEVYEDMYKLAEDGKDPLKDYASYTADKRRVQEKEQQEKKEREERAQKDIEEFSSKYPNVNISSLFKDEMFMDYAEGKNKSLVQTYESYNKLKQSFRNHGVEVAKKTVANSISSPGGLNNSTDDKVDYSTMSREEFLKEVEKVKERA